MLFHVSYMLLGVRFWPVVGKGGPALRFSGFLSGGLTEGGHLINLGLGSGCSGPFGSPWGTQIYLRNSVPAKIAHFRT